MKGTKTILTLALILIALLPTIALAAGTCALDKNEYNPGETATFACSCTLGNEQNIAGNILWVNSTNETIKNTTVNTGNCLTSPLVDQFTFPINANYSGNVTFQTTSTAWDDANDIINDTFNLTASSITDCLIANVSGRTANLGDIASAKIVLEDAITEQPLINGLCKIDVLTINGNHLITEPYDINEKGKLTTSGGELVFQHELSESFWTTNTTYLAEIHCECLPSITGRDCYFNNNGTATGFRQCSTETILVTGNADGRTVDEGSTGGVAITIFILFSALLIILLPFIVEKFSNNPFANLIIKRGIMTIGVWLMMFNSAIMSTISRATGLGIEREMFRYMWIFGIAGYLLTFWMFIKTIFDIIKMYKTINFEKRMGGKKE